MWNGNQWIIRSPALFNTIATNEIFWLYYLEQLVILHSSNLYTYRHNFSISATLFQLICPSETVLLSNLSKDDEQWHLFATTLKEDELPR